MAKYLNLKLELKVVKLCQPNNIQWYTFLTARTANWTNDLIMPLDWEKRNVW